ncbi:MAG: hypothetical protein ABMA02_07740 [Saprospiraceae bacterium]
MCKTHARNMVIESTSTETIIRIPTSMMTQMEVQDLLDYLFYREITLKSKATKKDVVRLSKLVKKGWWEANKDKLMKDEHRHS